MASKDAECPRCNDHVQYGCSCTTYELADWQADEITRLEYRVELLQHVIDIRPAKNAGLVTAYAMWTDNIYRRELNEAIAAQNEEMT